MPTINRDKAQMFIETVQTMGLGAEMLGVVPQEGAWGGTLAAQGTSELPL